MGVPSFRAAPTSMSRALTTSPYAVTTQRFRLSKHSFARATAAMTPSTCSTMLGGEFAESMNGFGR